MKNVILKYVSACLTVWYCLSIIGFDVHACSTTGNIFVNSVLSGTTCEDIHPGHHCDEHGGCYGCCDSSCTANDRQFSDVCLESTEKECCTNDIEVLDSESIQFSNENHLIFSEALSCLYVVNNYDFLLFARSMESSYDPDSGFVKIPDVQVSINILRI